MAVDLSSSKHDEVSPSNITTNRAAIDVSFDQNFDDIYNRRFKKYCLLLAKERELLKRLGKVRQLKCYNVQNEENNLNDDDMLHSGLPGSTQRQRSSKEYRSYTPLQHLAQYRKFSASVDDVGYDNKNGDQRTSPSSYVRHNSRNGKLHHAKSFDDVSFAEEVLEDHYTDDEGNFQAEHSATGRRRQKSFVPSSSNPDSDPSNHQLQKEKQLSRNRNDSGFSDGYWQTRFSGRKSKSMKEMKHLLPPPKPRLTSYKRLSTSYEEIDQHPTDDDRPPANHPRLLQPRRSAPHYFDEHQNEELAKFATRLPHSKSCDGTSFSLARKLSTRSERFEEKDAPRSSNPTVDLAVNDLECTLQKRERNTLITSSYRDLSDRNVRDVKKMSKKLRSWSPALERRLAEAKERQWKRNEVLKSFDQDFNKAKEIMEKYKSSENLSRYQSEENLTGTEPKKQLPRKNLTEPDDVKIKRRSWTFFQ